MFKNLGAKFTQIMKKPIDDVPVDFWDISKAEKHGWLEKQGAVVKTWRKRYFIMKQGKLFWFLDEHVTMQTKTRGVIDCANNCVSVKGAEDFTNEQNSFEISQKTGEIFYFICPSKKEKEEWINRIGRAIVLGKKNQQQQQQQQRSGF
jgi:hypothetical protein